jgi:hypothetical protein
VGSFDTDAFGVLLRMKSKVCQTVNNSFKLSSQPQAGVSKHATWMHMPACKGLSKWEERAGERRLPAAFDARGPSSPSPSSHVEEGDQ